MKNTGKCPKCESKNLLGNVVIVDYGHADITRPLKVEVLKNPNAIFFKEPVESQLLAWICIDCGFTEIYTNQPQKLLDAYRVSKANKKGS